VFQMRAELLQSLHAPNFAVSLIVPQQLLHRHALLPGSRELAQAERVRRDFPQAVTKELPSFAFRRAARLPVFMASPIRPRCFVGYPQFLAAQEDSTVTSHLAPPFCRR